MQDLGKSMETKKEIESIEGELEKLVITTPNLDTTWKELGDWFIALSKVQIRLIKLNIGLNKTENQ